MEHDGSMIFPCDLSTKIYNNFIVFSLFGVACLLVALFTGVWPLAIIGVFLLLYDLFMICWVRRTITSSYLSLTVDGSMEVHIWKRKKVVYPVSEIEWICDVNDKDELSRFKYWTYPVSFGRGGDILPDRGVIVRFNRQWSKSAMLVLFNPVDRKAFISELISRNPNIIVKTPEQ